MGKGSKRREFDKKAEKAFKKNYNQTYKSRRSDHKSSATSSEERTMSSRTIYVMRDGKLVPKRKNQIEILPVPDVIVDARHAWQKFIDAQSNKQLRSLARVASVTSKQLGIK